MKIDLKRIRPYVDSIRVWLINLSVASVAVGLFDEAWLGLPVGVALLFAALFVVFCQERYMK